MTIQATVVIPTHDHGPLLSRALWSAQIQTVEAIEILVVGDGVPLSTRGLVADSMKADHRVRFLDNPKGARRGETHRHAALAGARGAIVCYLADDDLWLPTHVESMFAILRRSDFAIALPLEVNADGSLVGWPADLSDPFFRELIVSGRGGWPPLSCGAHSLDAYRRLGIEWSTTPPGEPTDRYMWQKFLLDPNCRAATSTSPTVLHFSGRHRLTDEERLVELDHWVSRIADRAWCDRFPAAVLDAMVVFWARLHTDVDIAARGLPGVTARRELEDDLAEMRTALAQSLLQQREATKRSREQAREIVAIHSTITWRLRGRLLRLPGLARAVRSVAAVRAGRGAR